jgi:hypothetical protein
MLDRNPDEFIEHPELEDTDDESDEELPDLGDFEGNLNA